MSICTDHRSTHLLVACADIGSVRAGRFGWAARDHAGAWHDGSEPGGLADLVAASLHRTERIALGFECPLFVPVPQDPSRLTSARTGEGNRPWSAGAGASALATGLTEVVWILRRIRSLAWGAEGFLAWDELDTSQSGVLFWEAFVTAGSKGATHRADARIAVEAFNARLDYGPPESDVSCEHPHSLIGAAMLSTGWSTHLSVLSQPSIVIRATAP